MNISLGENRDFLQTLLFYGLTQKIVRSLLKLTHKKTSHFCEACGSSRVRTADPLLVRQML